jgi:DNA-binding NtrC family response regulator
MLAYAWPGNVRELQNTVERTVILTGENLPVSCSALGLPVLDRPIAAAAPVPPAEEASTGMLGPPAGTPRASAGPGNQRPG